MKRDKIASTIGWAYTRPEVNVANTRHEESFQKESRK